MKEWKGKLKIVTDPLEADVYLDGRPRGKAPLILGDVPFGRHMLELRKSGFRNLVVEVIVDSPDQTRIGVHLDKAPDEAADGGVKGGRGSKGDGIGSESSGPVLGENGAIGQTPESTGTTFADVAPWVLVAAGAVAAAAGIGFEVYASNAADAADRERDRYSASKTASVIQEHYENAEHNRKIARTNEIVGTTLIGVGAAALCGGVLWLLLDGGDAADAALSFTPGPGGGMLTLIGSFQ